MATIIQLRGDTAANWTSVNPTLANREFALETDTRKYKIGDGVTSWTGLTYSSIDVVLSGGTNINITNDYEINVDANVDFTSMSADTIYSGGTNLYDIFVTEDTTDVTRVQPGTNISTGGTVNEPTVNLIADIDVTTLSADTIYSGSTDIDTLFAKPSDIPTTFPYDLTAAASDETTAIEAGTTKLTFLAPRNFTLTAVTASLTTTGSTDSVVDLNVNGSSVFASPITITSGDYYQEKSTSTSAITQYDTFTVDIDTAGTDAAGLKFILLGYSNL